MLSDIRSMPSRWIQISLPRQLWRPYSQHRRRPSSGGEHLLELGDKHLGGDRALHDVEQSAGAAVGRGWIRFATATTHLAQNVWLTTASFLVRCHVPAWLELGPKGMRAVAVARGANISDGCGPVS
jgi:hypothetical protein